MLDRLWVTWAVLRMMWGRAQASLNDMIRVAQKQRKTQKKVKHGT